MKVKVLKAFKDRNNNALCKEGVILDLPENRVKEINSTGYGTFLAIVSEEVQPVTEDKTENEVTVIEKEDNKITVTDDRTVADGEENEDKPLNDMTVAQLKELAETLNIELDSKDKKGDIIAKINQTIGDE